VRWRGLAFLHHPTACYNLQHALATGTAYHLLAAIKTALPSAGMKNALLRTGRTRGILPLAWATAPPGMVDALNGARAHGTAAAVPKANSNATAKTLHSVKRRAAFFLTCSRHRRWTARNSSGIELWWISSLRGGHVPLPSLPFGFAHDGYPYTGLHRYTFAAYPTAPFARTATLPTDTAPLCRTRPYRPPLLDVALVRRCLR